MSKTPTSASKPKKHGAGEDTVKPLIDVAKVKNEILKKNEKIAAEPANTPKENLKMPLNIDQPQPDPEVNEDRLLDDSSEESVKEVLPEEQEEIESEEAISVRQHSSESEEEEEPKKMEESDPNKELEKKRESKKEPTNNTKVIIKEGRPKKVRVEDDLTDENLLLTLSQKPDLMKQLFAQMQNLMQPTVPTVPVIVRDRTPIDDIPTTCKECQTIIESICGSSNPRPEKNVVKLGNDFKKQTIVGAIPCAKCHKVLALAIGHIIREMAQQLKDEKETYVRKTAGKKEKAEAIESALNHIIFLSGQLALLPLHMASPHFARNIEDFLTMNNKPNDFICFQVFQGDIILRLSLTSTGGNKFATGRFITQHYKVSDHGEWVPTTDAKEGGLVAPNWFAQFHNKEPYLKDTFSERFRNAIEGRLLYQPPMKQEPIKKRTGYMFDENEELF